MNFIQAPEVCIKGSGITYPLGTLSLTACPI